MRLRKPKLMYLGYFAIKSDMTWYLDFRRQEANGLLTWTKAEEILGDGNALADALREAGLPSRVSFYGGECLVTPYGRYRNYRADSRVIRRVLEALYPTFRELPMRWRREIRIHE